MANSDCPLIEQQETQILRFPLRQVRFFRLVRLHYTCAGHSKQGILVVTNQQVPGGYDRSEIPMGGHLLWTTNYNLRFSSTQTSLYPNNSDL
jgi:hypothetical protein